MVFQGRDEVRFSDGSTAQKVAPVTESGAPVNPAHEDGNLQALAHATDYVVSAACRVAIDSTSRLITALSGAPATIPDDLIRIALVPESGTADQVRFALSGAASAATSPQWPSQGVDSMPLAASAARTVQVVSTGGTLYATLFILTPRSGT